MNSSASFIPSWRQHPITVEESIYKMQKNAHKAAQEWYEEKVNNGSPFTATKDGIDAAKAYQQLYQFPVVNLRDKKSILQFQYNISALQGEREHMEDRCVYLQNPQGRVFGCVLDGYGGDTVARFVASYMEKNFWMHWKEHEQEGHVHRVLEQSFDQAQQSLYAKRQEPKICGATATAVFLDPGTHCVYTATLGSCHAMLHRKEGQDFVSKPLSCLRSWNQKKERERVVDQEKFCFMQYPTGRKSTYLVRNDTQQGLQASRAFSAIEHPYLTHKPKISLAHLHEGDVVVITTKGVTDYVPNYWIKQRVLSPDTITSTAEDITKLAVRLGGDNASAIVIRASCDRQ